MSPSSKLLKPWSVPDERLPIQAHVCSSPFSDCLPLLSGVVKSVGGIEWGHLVYPLALLR